MPRYVLSWMLLYTAIMARLFYGGSFNPIHIGHLICARAVAEARGFQNIVLVPCAQPPHKPDIADLAPASDRLAMIQLAIQDQPLFSVDDLELRRGGPSYTLDTIHQLKRRGEREVHWLIGADMLNMLPDWHGADELIREARLVVVARPGWQFDWQNLPPDYRSLQMNVVEAPLIDISASQLRHRLVQGLAIRWLTPLSVERYIHTNGLYRGRDS